MRMTFAAWMNRVLRYLLPRLEMRPRIDRPPVLYWRGTRLSHAPKSRPRVAALPDDEFLRQEIHNILNLRKENAKLRELAVKLSNVLGDLPAGECEDAVAHAYGPPMRFDRYGRRSTVRGSQCRQGRGSFDLDHAVLNTIPALKSGHCISRHRASALPD